MDSVDNPKIWPPGLLAQLQITSSVISNGPPGKFLAPSVNISENNPRMKAPVIHPPESSSTNSQLAPRLLAQLFPPAPVEWARERARECAASGGRISPWPNPMPGLSLLGLELQRAYHEELGKYLAPRPKI